MVKFVRKFFYLSPPVATISTKIPSPRIAGNMYLSAETRKILSLERLQGFNMDIEVKERRNI